MISDRLYEKLSPLERLRATIAARSRGDQSELERLVHTCPERHYKAVDFQFTGRADVLHLTALAHAADVHKLAYRTALLTSYVLAIEHDLSTEEELTSDQQRLWDCYEYVTAQIQELCAKVEGWERGFEAFCESLGFDSAEVRKGHGITRVHLTCDESDGNDLFRLITLGELDQKVVRSGASERYELYRQVWMRSFQRDLPAFEVADRELIGEVESKSVAFQG